MNSNVTITIVITLITFILVSSIFTFRQEKNLVLIEAETISKKDIFDLPNLTEAFPPRNINNQDFAFQSQSGLLFDLESGTTLTSKNTTAKVQIASLTKLMTALITIENIELSEKVVTPSYVAEYCGSCMYLLESEEILVETLLDGLLINSANDAAKAIEYHYNQDSSRNLFTQQMNAKAELLGMNGTNYDNPVGLDSEKNYSTVKDLKTLVRVFMSNSQLAERVSTKDKSVYGVNNEYHYLKNTNKLLQEGDEDIIGIKTGTTDLAGESLIFAFQKDEHTYVGILLNSPDRYEEARDIIKWINTNLK